MLRILIRRCVSHQPESRPRLRASVAILCVILFLGAGSVRAQQRITFNDAVQIALEQNVQIRKAQNQLDLSDLEVRRARMSLVNPVSVSSTAYQSWGLYQDPTTYQVRSTSSQSAQISTGLNVSVFDPQYLSDLRSNKATVNQQEFLFESSRQMVISQVIQRYLQITLAIEQVRIREENLEDQKRQLADIEEFVRIGQRPVTEQRTQQVAVSQAELDLLTARTDLQLARTEIVQTLQLDPFGAYEFVVPDLESPVVAANRYEPEQMLRTAFAQRPDLQAVEAQIEASHFDLKAARNSRLPRLSMNANISSGWSSTNDLGLSDQLRTNRREGLGFSLNLPIFSFLANRTQIETSEVQYQNALYDLETQRLDIAVSVQQAYINYQTNVQRLDLTEKQLAQAQEALDLVRDQYNLGSSSLLELSQAQSEFVRLSGERARAIVQYHFQRLLMDYEQGTLDPEAELF